MLSAGSLFSGIGGFELGARIAGVEVDWRWQVEQDAFCRSVLARHFPHASRSVTDVCEAGAANLERVDVIVGGFPCQDLSVAGSGAGLAGERSGLWREYARIVRELRPRFVLVENVSALLARGLGVVLGDLAACGYDAEWDCIPASALGAPHQRDRVWLVAHARGDGGGEQPKRHQREGRGAREAERRDTDALHAGAAREAADAVRDDGGQGRPGRTGGSDSRHEGVPDGGDEAPDAARPRLEGRREGLPSDGSWDWRLAPPPVRGVDDGFPAGVDRRSGRRRDRDRLKALGNALVPEVAALLWRRVAEVAPC